MPGYLQIARRIFKMCCSANCKLCSAVW